MRVVGFVLTRPEAPVADREPVTLAAESLRCEGAGGATEADLVAAYANRNLNSINYNRERGDYGIFTISFPQPTDTFFIFERGMDSDIHLDALDDAGSVVGHWDFLRSDGYRYSGVNIVTDTGFPGWPTTGA